MKQLAFDFVPAAAPTLDNFIGGANAEALAHLRALGAVATERFVYLWGAPGSGRTHLLRGAVEALHRRGSRAAFVANDAALLALEADACDAAAIDDVDRLGEDAQRALFNVYNRLRETGGVLLASGPAPPARLALRADVCTRLAWGLTYEVHALADGDKARALCEHAAGRGFALPPEVAQYLLNHVERDLRTLVAMVESIDRYSLETKRAVSVPLVKDLLAMKVSP